MAPEAVKPLNITKSTMSPSPSRMTSPPSARALQEISPMGVRRNSPSFNQATKKLAFPLDSSPFDSSVTSGSPRNFWAKRETASPVRHESENIRPGKGLTRRSSIEDLKKASRVTNSTMYAREQEQEYDPESSVLIERPLASGPPISLPWGNGFEEIRAPTSPSKGHKRSGSRTDIPVAGGGTPPRSLSPSKHQSSPQKSSLSSTSRFNTFDLDQGTWSDGEDRPIGSRGNTPRAELRHHKSVTFDNAPPQVNEYEMITPDPSSVASGSREGSYDSDTYDMDESFERETSPDREDSFDDSLEDADKTPVVLPEDWRFMSPDAANTGFSKSFEDPFAESNTEQQRSTSVDSDERPLPPLPPQSKQTTPTEEEPRVRPGSASPTSRSHPSPPRPASISKAELLGMQATPMPLEERLRLMALQDEENNPKPDEKDVMDFFRRSQSHNEDDISEPTKQLQGPPRISRESILRKLQEQDFGSGDESSPVHARGSIDYANLDPDEPIPSRENSSLQHYIASDVPVKQEEEDENVKIIEKYSSPAFYASPAPSDDGVEASVIHHNLAKDVTPAADVASKNDSVLPKSIPEKTTSDSRMSLPDFVSFGDDDFAFGLSSFMSQSPPTPPEISYFNSPSPAAAPSLLHSSQEPAQRSVTPVEAAPNVRSASERPITPREPTPAKSVQGQSSREPSQRPITPREATPARTEETLKTPESVIHKPDQAVYSEEDTLEDPEESIQESLVVPEPVATIKAPGSRLKTRPSATPADIQSMVAARRQASGERPSSVGENDQSMLECDAIAERNLTLKDAESDIKLDVPVEAEFGLSEEFERVIEAQKRGYMMRQNTKVVVASNRQASGESKASDKTDKPSEQAGPQKQAETTWKTEPWNGKMRRQSTRRQSIMPDQPLSTGAVPPLPGHVGNTTEIHSEDLTAAEDNDGTSERGRLFVKVMSVKDVELPLPKNERSYFQLTLDNGLHCVTTSWLELGRTAAIGQEFELVVFDDLEFQLTLQTSLERPQSQAGSVKSTVSSAPSAKASKAPGLSRLFQSPKKRRELERKQREEEEQAQRQKQREMEAQRVSREPTAWDLQNQLVGPDGSFARAYVSLSNHEEQVYGRPCIVDVPCFNEWALEDKEISDSTRSKLGGAQRRPPYKIARMELQLLYIPKPKDATDDEMPKSMAAAVKQLRDAETSSSVYFEGHLSQQGGDCPYWRRRFFKLNGTRLTAYHEATRQPRVSISLAKALKLIDDRSQLTKADGSPAKGGKARRRSAFAEEEEGYMFVEEGFRIRFANGEIIDFYADSTSAKEAWMKVLSQVVGKDIEKQTWMSIVLAKERAKKTQPPSPAKPIQAKSAPTSPQKRPVIPERKPAPAPAAAPAPVDKSPRHMTRPSSPTKPGFTPRSSLPKQATPIFGAAKGSPSKASPSKESPSKASPTKGNSALPTPRLQKLNANKRQGVRSMIF